MNRHQTVKQETMRVNEFEGLARSILRAYGLRVQAVIKMRTVYGLVCADDSRWIVKPVPKYEQSRRLRAIAAVASHVHKETGIQLAAPVPCQSGGWMMHHAGYSWYLQPWLRGRHVDLAESSERRAAVETVARVHAATQEVTSRVQVALPTSALSQRLMRKRTAVVAVWNQAATRMPGLETVRKELFSRMQGALSAAGNVAAASSVQVFSHRDLAPHNMLWSDTRGERAVHLIDFDRAGFDLPYLDLMQLCSHSLHFCNDPNGLFRDITRTYRQTSSLALDEEVLRALLRFPDLFVRALLEWARTGFGRRGQRAVQRAIVHELRRAALCTEL